MGALFLDIENDGDLDLYPTMRTNPTSSTSTMGRESSMNRRQHGASTWAQGMGSMRPT